MKEVERGTICGLVKGGITFEQVSWAGGKYDIQIGCGRTLVVTTEGAICCPHCDSLDQWPSR